MSRTVRTLLMFALAALIASPAAAQDDEWRWSGGLAAGKTLEIKNVNGPLFAERSTGDTVEVVAIKDGPRRDREAVEIRVVEHADGITVCAIYTDDRRGNSCEPGDRGRLSSDDNDAEVTFRVRVPADVAYVARTMNGRIEVNDLRSDVEVQTMNGAIEISTSGWASAQTMNGAIEVDMGTADWTGDMEVSTMNGQIVVHLPADADVDLDATTMNGNIYSDFPISVSGWLRNRARGRIGDGGRGLEVSTMNGGIRILGS